MRQRVEKNKKPSGSMYFIMIQYLLSEAVFIKKREQNHKVKFQIQNKEQAERQRAQKTQKYKKLVF